MNNITISKGSAKKIKLDYYAGKWVAFIDREVIAAADTLKELEEKVKKLTLKKQPAYFLVPRKDEGPYILLVKNEKRI